MKHKHKWEYAGQCSTTTEICKLPTYNCSCGAYKLCDGEIVENMCI